jgi:hypothetical protein
MSDERPQLIAVVATVNLDGLRRGEEALVDPTNANVAAWLNALYLIPLPADEQPD